MFGSSIFLPDIETKQQIMSKRFRQCVFPYERFITEVDTHGMCVSCLGMSHAQAALKGAACDHCEALPLRVLRSRAALFLEDGRMRSPRGTGPAVAEASQRLRSWGSQREIAEGAGKAEAFFWSSSPRPRSGARFSVSPTRGASLERLTRSGSEELDVLSIEETECHQPSPGYEELLEVVTRAVAKLHIDWPQAVQQPSAGSKLDERFLQHRAPARLSTSPRLDYGNVTGIRQHGYGAMPRVEEALASYLSPNPPP